MAKQKKGKEEKKKIHVSAYLDEFFYEQITKLAAREDLPVALVVRRLIKDGLQYDAHKQKTLRAIDLSPGGMR